MDELVPGRVSVSGASLRRSPAESFRVSFDVGWAGSWRGPHRPSWVASPDNWDAVWLFVKFRHESGPWYHVPLTQAGHVVPETMHVAPSPDGRGVFIYRASAGTGDLWARDVHLLCDLDQDTVPPAADVEVRVFGLEMVLVQRGPFYLGSGGTDSSMFRSRGTKRPFYVEEQVPIELGVGDQRLNWTVTKRSGRPEGKSHSQFPTGVDGFYMMKYPVTRGQYAGFLNTLSERQAVARLMRRPKSFEGLANRPLDEIEGGRPGEYFAPLPESAMNWLGWSDGAAFSAWAGLRPMTELEFEKVARGPLPPVANEYVWGSPEILALRWRSTAGRDTERRRSEEANAVYGNGVGHALTRICVGHFAAPGRTRVQAGASYYGALDLSGGLWEQVVSIGHPSGQRFTGLHGNGELDRQGDAEVTGWPDLDSSGGPSPHSIRGTGHRGGSFLEAARFLRTSDRTHAEFGHSMRHFTLGWRACRSIPNT